jgi:hypothetical protein
VIEPSSWLIRNRRVFLVVLRYKAVQRAFVLTTVTVVINTILSHSEDHSPGHSQGFFVESKYISGVGNSYSCYTRLLVGPEIG